MAKKKVAKKKVAKKKVAKKKCAKMISKSAITGKRILPEGTDNTGPRIKRKK